MSGENQRLRSVFDSDGGAVLDINRGTITTLNATGAFVFQEVGRGRTEDEIIAALAERTGESIQTVADDTREFLAMLSSRKLIPALGEQL